jgi:hypothetical protein
MRWLRRRRTEAEPQVCTCGRPLHTRVVGVVQRAGLVAEPVNVIACLHCTRCGDIKPS